MFSDGFKPPTSILRKSMKSWVTGIINFHNILWDHWLVPWFFIFYLRMRLIKGIKGDYAGGKRYGAFDSPNKMNMIAAVFFSWDDTLEHDVHVKVKVLLQNSTNKHASILQYMV